MNSIEDIMAMAQNVQNELAKAQDGLDKIEVEGAAGGGLVKVQASAKGRIIGITIDESLLQPSEKQMLEDLVVAAFNDAKAKADAASGAEMAKMTSGIPLPPGFKLPF
ncbi:MULTISPECIES: YbaB/EbfC family nucleoid-associated protein [Sphingomonas]|uniref:YbaB/EbfC family nucleoid-associated protein n=1 Tax=Sphingomonas TaxID=13687 RepID=UPI0010405921|nr:YbaB/EbfC family nucleoid-associated protein [Sphingomonas echinoides]